MRIWAYPKRAQILPCPATNEWIPFLFQDRDLEDDDDHISDSEDEDDIYGQLFLFPTNSPHTHPYYFQFTLDVTEISHVHWGSDPNALIYNGSAYAFLPDIFEPCPLLLEKVLGLPFQQSFIEPICKPVENASTLSLLVVSFPHCTSEFPQLQVWPLPKDKLDTVDRFILHALSTFTDLWDEGNFVLLGFLFARCTPIYHTVRAYIDPEKQVLRNPGAEKKKYEITEDALLHQLRQKMDHIVYTTILDPSSGISHNRITSSSLLAILKRIQQRVLSMGPRGEHKQNADYNTWPKEGDMDMGSDGWLDFFAFWSRINFGSLQSHLVRKCPMLHCDKPDNDDE